MRKTTILGTITLLTILNSPIASAAWEQPTLVYGGGLSATQQSNVDSLLKVDSAILKKTTTSKDVERYLGVSGTSDANLFSSTLVTKTTSNGVKVNIVTPENITKITKSQYANAAITAGAKNVSIDVASPVKVTGESALTGVYIALESNGEQVDKERTLVAQQELETVNEIAQVNKSRADFNPESLDLAVTEVKQELAAFKGEATEQQVKDVVNDAIANQGLQDIVTPEQVDKLVTFAKAYQQTDAISSDEVAKQLDAFKGETQKYIEENYGKVEGKIEGFFKSISDFFEGLWKAISNIFA